MDEVDGTITEAVRLRLHKRLSDHLRIPGRLDEAIYVLGIEANNMFSPNAATATLARVICDQLELRHSPAASTVAKLLEEWETSQPPPVNLMTLPQPKSPQFSPAEMIAILGPQIVLGLMIANFSLAALSLWMGKSLVEVVVLWFGLTSLTLASVYFCSRFSQAPKSIPEAQFIFQAHQGRMEYAVKGLLDQPTGRPCLLTTTHARQVSPTRRVAAPHGLPPVLCVASGKGGVGKTSLALCVANEVARSARSS